MKGRSNFFAASSAAFILRSSVVPGLFPDRLLAPSRRPPSFMAAAPRRRFSGGVATASPGDVETRGMVPFRETAAAAISKPCCWLALLTLLYEYRVGVR